MHEIDLIPREHVEWRRVRRWLRRSAALLALMAAATVLGRVLIDRQATQERPRLEQARQAGQRAAAQQARQAELEARRADAESRLAALRQLHNPGWELALQSIDTAAGPKVWLDRLTFAGAATELAGASPTTGADAARAAVRVPAVLRGIEVKGHAVDHAAVTEFMRRLADHQGVHGVRLLDTGLRRYSTVDVVDFSVSAGIATTPQERP